MLLKGDEDRLEVIYRSGIPGKFAIAEIYVKVDTPASRLSLATTIATQSPSTLLEGCTSISI